MKLLLIFVCSLTISSSKLINQELELRKNLSFFNYEMVNNSTFISLNLEDLSTP